MGLDYIPENMTEEEVMGVIETVVDRMAHKYTFFSYDVDDVKQEAFIECLEALPRYDNDRPLENFLSSHLRFRMINLLRKNRILDANYKSNIDSEYMKVIRPAQLEDGCSVASNEETVDYTSIDYKDMVDIINKELPASVRMDYLKMINGMYIPKPRRLEITNMIINILAQNGYEEGKDE